mgnify:CR=1 FL=1
MTKFLLPIAINVIYKAVDKIPEDLETKLKEFVIALIKKAYTCRVKDKTTQDSNIDVIDTRGVYAGCSHGCSIYRSSLNFKVR